MKCFGLIATALLSLAAGAREWRFPLSAAPDDFGSGTVAQSGYSPGGIPKVGVFAGHANLLTRKDRILLRFDLTDFYLGEALPEITGARLEFTLWYVAGASEGTEVRAEHLDYERETFTSEDLSNPQATPVGSAPVHLEKHPPEGEDGHYAFDVTEAVRGDLANLRPFASFRLSDSCEEEGNATGSAVGFLIQTPNLGRGAIPVLVVETGEDEPVKGTPAK